MSLRQSARRGRGGRCAAVLCWLWLIVLPGLAHAQTERVTGEWQQFVMSQDSWRALGVYRVEQSDGAYRMEPVSQLQEPDVTPSKGLTNVRFSGTEWTFSSDWGNGNVAEFRLRHLGPGVYVGWSYLREKEVNLNLWLLVR